MRRPQFTNDYSESFSAPRRALAPLGWLSLASTPRTCGAPRQRNCWRTDTNRCNQHSASSSPTAPRGQRQNNRPLVLVSGEHKSEFTARFGSVPKGHRAFLAWRNDDRNEPRVGTTRVCLRLSIFQCRTIHLQYRYAAPAGFTASGASRCQVTSDDSGPRAQSFQAESIALRFFFSGA